MSSLQSGKIQKAERKLEKAVKKWILMANYLQENNKHINVLINWRLEPDDMFEKTMTDISSYIDYVQKQGEYCTKMAKCMKKYQSLVSMKQKKEMEENKIRAEREFRAWSI